MTTRITPRLWIKNPGIIELRWTYERCGDTPPLDAFFYKQLEKVDHLDHQLRNGFCHFKCRPCDLNLTSVEDCFSHYHSEDHVEKQERLVIRHHEPMMEQRRAFAIQSGITTIKKAMAVDDETNFYGTLYLLEFHPEELDDVPVYACALPYCQFLGYANEAIHHFSMIDHQEGYLDINGCLGECDVPKILSLLHEFDLESSGNGCASGLVKKVASTCDYQVARTGCYPPAYQDFVLDKVIPDYEENRTRKTYVPDEEEKSPPDLEPNGTPVFKSRNPSESDGGGVGSVRISSLKTDLKDHLKSVKKQIYAMVAEEFKKAGRFNGPSLITEEVMKQLTQKYYQDEKLFFEDNLWEMTVTDDVRERVGFRVQNFLTYDM